MLRPYSAELCQLARFLDEAWNLHEKSALNLQIAAAFHGFQHGDFIGVLEVGAYGNADPDSRHANSQGL